MARQRHRGDARQQLAAPVAPGARGVGRGRVAGDLEIGLRVVRRPLQRALPEPERGLVLVQDDLGVRVGRLAVGEEAARAILAALA